MKPIEKMTFGELLALRVDIEHRIWRFERAQKEDPKSFQMSEIEREVFEMRASKKTWKDISEMLNVSAYCAKKIYKKACEKKELSIAYQEVSMNERMKQNE